MNDLPKRKQNRLNNYDYSQNGAYFITICTKNKECIFGSIVGCDAHIAPKIILTEYGKIAKKHIELIPGIDKYVIMPNHIHLIILKGGAMWASHPTSVSQDIRSLKILVSKQISKSIWQTSFYDHIIRDEEDYLTKCQYIENNPAKWLEDELYTP